MHYGDSQIEADRISGRERERLQKNLEDLVLEHTLLFLLLEKLVLKMNIQIIGSVGQDLGLILIQRLNTKNMVHCFLL